MKKIRNNGIFYVVIALVAIIGIGTGVLAYSVSQNINVSGDYNYYEAEVQPVEAPVFGAFSGPDVYADVNIYGSLTTGSNKNYATTTKDTDGALTLNFNDLNRYTYWDIMNEVADNSNLNFTLPATSTMMQLLPEIGSTRTWLFHNATTTENTLQLTAGAGMDLVGVTTNDDIIDALEYSQLTCTQIEYRAVADTNIVCIVDELTPVD